MQFLQYEPDRRPNAKHRTVRRGKRLTETRLYQVCGRDEEPVENVEP